MITAKINTWYYAIETVEFCICVLTSWFWNLFFCYWILVSCYWNLLFPDVFLFFATESYCFVNVLLHFVILFLYSGILLLEHYNLHFCHLVLTSCYWKLLFCYCFVTFCHWSITTYTFVIVFFYFDGVYFILVFWQGNMQFGMALSEAFLDTIIYFPPKCVCLESKMADEQAMIRPLLNNSLVSIVRELASEIFDSDRIDSLYYRIDWLYQKR